VNAIAGANKQRNQQTAVESESSTSTSDESSDDEMEMDAEPAENVAIQSVVSDHVDDAECDVETASASLDMSSVSQQQDCVENLSAKDTAALKDRQPAYHVAVNRAAEIQVFGICVLTRLCIVSFIKDT